MGKLEIGKIIYRLRKGKGITQEELGNFIGVSTAAVSKWESENSYPDITLLPTLATFFNISIDELLNFKIELSGIKINDIYRKCEKLFSNKHSINEAIKESKTYISKYFYSYELKNKIAYLFYIYSWKAENEEKSRKMILDAIKILEDIVLNCNENNLVEVSLFQLGALYSQIEENDKAINILNKIRKNQCDPNDIISNIYIKQNKLKEARGLLQSKIYKCINEISLACHGLSNSYIKDKKDLYIAERYYKLSLNLKKQFTVNKKDKLIMYMDYINLATLYLQMNNKVKALEMLKLMLENLRINDINSYNVKNELWCFNEIKVKEKSLSINLYENLFKIFEEPTFNIIRKDKEFIDMLKELKKLNYK